MLNIKMKVASIDYPATFHTLYPLLSAHFMKADGQSLLKSLIVSLGDNAEKVFLSWLPYLEETDRRKLIAGIVSQNSPRLTALMNEKLQSFEIGKSIQAEAVQAYLAEEDLFIGLDGVKLDLQKLVDPIAKKRDLNPIVALGVKALVKLDATFAEEKGVSFISTPEIKCEILKALQNVLTGKGIAVTVEDIDITYIPGEFTPPTAGTGKILDNESEKIIVNALARYLLDNTDRA